MGAGKISIAIDQLTVGVTCSQPIVGETGLLLLGANTRITQQVITGLRERGIDSIEVDPRDLALLRGDSRKKAAAKRDWIKDGNWPPNKPIRELLVDRYDEPLDSERGIKLVTQLDSAKEQFEEFKNQVAVQRLRSTPEFLEISDSYARSMIDDHDHTVNLIGNSQRSDVLSERSVRMSVLGMAVAIEMGLDGVQTLEVGKAGLLHDIGLFAMDPEMLGPIELMNESQLWEYQKHPLVSGRCIRDMLDVPHSVHLAVEQVHEQFDGSGYPRGVQGKRIHQYARILNVVEAYLQLTSSSDHRASIVPHDALGLLLFQASRGLFDPQVIKAFLNTETLFPLGSWVELSSGETGQVIRRPRVGFAAPVLVDRDGNRLELESTSLHIIRPVIDDSIHQVRLSQEKMRASDWSPANHLPVV